MATHTKKIDPSVKNRYQVFTNDTSLSDEVVFASGDYIDFVGSLGRPAKKVKIILNGIVSVVLQFNTIVKLSKHNESSADDTIELTEGINGTNTFRLFSIVNGRVEFECPAEFLVENIKIVTYTGTAGAADNLTIIGF